MKTKMSCLRALCLMCGATKCRSLKRLSKIVLCGAKISWVLFSFCDPSYSPCASLGLPLKGVLPSLNRVCLHRPSSPWRPCAPASLSAAAYQSPSYLLLCCFSGNNCKTNAFQFLPTVHRLLGLIILNLLFTQTDRAEVPVSRKRQLPVSSTENQLAAIEAETSVIADRAVASVQIRCLSKMTIAWIRAERSLRIVGRILLPECLLEWCNDKLYIDAIKRSLKGDSLVDISRHYRIRRKTDDLHLNPIHVDTKK